MATEAARTSGPVISFADCDLGHAGAPPVLGGITLAFAKGDCVAITGPNGSGKSTLLRTAAGLIPTLRGEVTRTGRIGYVPQSDEIDAGAPHTALDIVMSGLRNRLPGGWRAPRGAPAEALLLLEKVGLADRAHAQAATLSGGQRRRLLTARALALAPDALLLDEPATGLDPDSAESMHELIADLRREGAVALIFITHDPAAPAKVGATGLRVAAGRVVSV